MDPAAYSELMRLRELHATGRMAASEISARLAGLREREPSFAAVYLFSADLAFQRYFHSRSQEELERIFDDLRLAHQLAPADPQALYRLSQIALDAGHLDVARDAIEQLERLAPGDAQIDVRRALLYEREGHTERALVTVRRAAALHPSWLTLYAAARITYRAGHLDEAGEFLAAVLELAPEKGSVRSFLARIELVEGRLDRAEELYTELVRRQPEGIGERSNLGLVQMLRGRYAESAESFRAALDVEPESPLLILNLADAIHLGRGLEAARPLYEQVVAGTESAAISASAETSNAWQELTARAQAQAHLGRRAEAASAIQRALALGPENPQVAYEAALVYSLLGEEASALASARRARSSFGPRWFSLPWFDRLRENPEARQLFADEAD